MKVSKNRCSIIKLKFSAIGGDFYTVPKDELPLSTDRKKKGLCRNGVGAQMERIRVISMKKSNQFRGEGTLR